MNVLMSLAPVMVAAYALNVLLQVTAICLVSLLAARCAFRRDPSVRYCVCLAGLICILLSPLAACLQSKMGYGLTTLPLPKSLFQSLSSGAEGASTMRTDMEMHNGASEVHLENWIAGGIWAVLSVWAAGVVWGSVRLVRGWREASRLVHAVRPWEASGHVETLARLKCVLGRPIPPIFTSPLLTSPIAVDLFQPAVILPEGLAETLTSIQLRHVLLHECAHIAFRHSFGGVIERIAGVLFWPYLPVRALSRDLARAREEVCDNVASQEDGAACYARTLLAIAQGIDTASKVASALALLGPGTSLEERITGLLDPRRNRMVHVNRWKLWAVAGAVVSTLALAVGVRVVAAEGNTKQDVLAASGNPDSLTAKRIAEAKAKYAAVPAGARSQPLAVVVKDGKQRLITTDPHAAKAIITTDSHAAKATEAEELDAKRKAEMEEAEAREKVLKQSKSAVAGASNADALDAKHRAEAEAREQALKQAKTDAVRTSDSHERNVGGKLTELRDVQIRKIGQDLIEFWQYGRKVGQMHVTMNPNQTPEHGEFADEKKAEMEEAEARAKEAEAKAKQK